MADIIIIKKDLKKISSIRQHCTVLSLPPPPSPPPLQSSLTTTTAKTSTPLISSNVYLSYENNMKLQLNQQRHKTSQKRQQRLKTSHKHQQQQFSKIKLQKFCYLNNNKILPENKLKIIRLGQNVNSTNNNDTIIRTKQITRTRTTTELNSNNTSMLSRSKLDLMCCYPINEFLSSSSSSLGDKIKRRRCPSVISDDCRLPLLPAPPQPPSPPTTIVMTTTSVINSHSDNDNNNNNNKTINDNIRRRTPSRLKFIKTSLWSHHNNNNYNYYNYNLHHHWQLFLAVVHLILYIVSSPICLAARQDAVVNCTFPQRWEGSWFLSGYQQSIHIKGSQFSYRGKCTASDGNKYLIVDDRGCHRCLVIYEKHKNVLQYKESECEGDSMYMDQSNPAAMPMRSILKSDHNSRGGAHPNMNGGHSRLSSSDQYIMRSNDDINDCPLDFCKGRETLQNLCDQIPGDALLFSLFRENAEPVKCPLKGPFTFTYNRGHGECKSPVSNIESCTEESRLLLSFQACPDVQGTESTVEELTCLATWKDGNSRYLVGLVSHHHAISNEERYRCFVYEKMSTLIGTIPGGLSNPNLKDAEYKLAQSGDATCNGLDSAEVGSRIMTLRKPPPAERCDFPIWFKGPKHWHALMGNAGYVFHSGDGSMHITKSNGFMETRALCEQINHQTSTEMMAVVHYTTGCQSGFMCMMFYRRDTHIAEIQTGTPAPRLEDACASDHFDINNLPYITLLASSSESQICPLEGLYNLRGAIGPPYVTSRHKRNHNNKIHNQHGHHHHESGHRRHMTLSFRNSEEFGNTFWHSRTRGLPIRNRRAATSTSSSSGATSSIDSTASSSSSSLYEFVPIAMPLTDSSSIQRNSQSSSQLINGMLNRTSSRNGNSMQQQQYEFNVNDTQRNRRDVPGCTVNYKSKRQLWIGCTEPNLIDVRPQCTDNGDEVYSCHGSWTENGTVYIIAKHSGTQHGVCITYRLLDNNNNNNAAKLIIGDGCYRGGLLQQKPPPDHHLIANLTVFGKCGDTNSSKQIRNNWILILYCITMTITAALSVKIKCGDITFLLLSSVTISSSLLLVIDFINR